MRSPYAVRILLSLLALLPLPLLAQGTASLDDFDPYFLGYETEPDMDYAGRTVMSLQSGLSRALGAVFDVEERPGLAPAWEFPLAAVLMLVQHEIGGHGGRARELSLDPSYGINWDLSAYTSTRHDPETTEQLAILAAGGAEADTVMSYRAILDLVGPDGADGSKVPLVFMAKLDLPLYVFGTPSPRPGTDEEDFGPQSEEGNDVAIYLVSRQGRRAGADASVIWNGGYVIDFEDPLLQENWDDARVTAAWSLLDPSLVAAMFAYFKDHVFRGQRQVRAPGLRLPNGSSLLVGTRGSLGPQTVSRFLDIYLNSEWGLATFYVRDLDSSVDRAYGFGAGLHDLRLGQKARLSLAADVWQEPDSIEGFYEGTGWNANAEIETMFGSRWGGAAKVGAKSDGFFPGLPMDEGVYLGLGLQAAW